MEWFVFPHLAATLHCPHLTCLRLRYSFFVQIYRAAVKLVGDMSQISRKLSENSISLVAGHGVFGIKTSSDQTNLVFPDGFELAQLNDKTAEALRDFIDVRSVQYDALVDLTTLRETMARATKASDAALHVNINLYGSRNTREIVGDRLSDGKIYLQHPDQQRPASTYDNPHFLALPEIQLQCIDLKPQEAVKSVLQGDEADQFDKAVSDVYCSLKRGSHLKGLVGGTHLKTSLLL
jgi:SWI/SNF-related matrix-associated actin-dependent regulator of chromatin subfamily A3